MSIVLAVNGTKNVVSGKHLIMDEAIFSVVEPNDTDATDCSQIKRAKHLINRQLAKLNSGTY